MVRIEGRIVDDEPFYTRLINIEARDSEHKKELEREHLGAVYEGDIEKVIDDYKMHWNIRKRFST